jgi:hypothetical protein
MKRLFLLATILNIKPLHGQLIMHLPLRVLLRLTIPHEETHSAEAVLIPVSISILYLFRFSNKVQRLA